MTTKQRQKIFSRQVARSLNGDLGAAELVLRLSSSPEEDSKPKIIIEYADDEPGDVTFEDISEALPPGAEPLLLAAGPSESEEPADAPEPAEQPAQDEPLRITLEQRRNRLARQPQCYEQLSQEQQEEYARDGWRSCPDHLRPRAEGVAPDYENCGFADGRQRGRSAFDMSWDGPNSVWGRR